MAAIIIVVAAYLLGSISFAVVTSRAFGLPDPRSYGSGNPGATNVLRTGRKAAAALTLLGDGGKGWLAVYLARMAEHTLGLGEWVTAGAALAAFLGHLYPVFLGFRGGKGVATALGVLLALSWPIGLAAAAIWLATAALWRYSSLASLAAAGSAPLMAAGLQGMAPTTAAIAVMSAFLFARHRGNIHKLRAGTESKIGARAGSNAAPPAS